jgi:hypothetical protein
MADYASKNNLLSSQALAASQRANRPARLADTNGGAAQGEFNDNRPQAVAQRRLQTMADNSPRLKRLQGFSDMAQNSPQAVQLQARMTQLRPLHGSRVIQAKIDDQLTQEKIRSAYQGNNLVSHESMRLFLQDAFDNTDTYQDAIARINRGIRHELAMTSFQNEEAISQLQLPGEKTSKERHPIDIRGERERPEFVSSVPDADVAEDELTDEWKGLNTQQFYAKIRKSLKIARDSDHVDQSDEIARLDKLIQGYRQHKGVKALVDKAVRVKAVKAKGASSGTGLDELFKTSETMKYLELSYRPPKGKSAIAKFDGDEFDWMDAQQQMRLSTEFIIWAGDLVNTLSGHTGTLQNQYMGNWMTEKQSLMHEVRDDAISERSNPATAIIEAIGTHLRITQNVEGFLDNENFNGESAKKALLPNGRSVHDQFDFIKKELEKHRDMLKHSYDYLVSKFETIGNSSPLQHRFGGDDYYPNSPIGNDDMDIEEEKGKVAGNPLLNLSVQSRLEYEEDPINIPRKPVNPAIVDARDQVKKELGTKEATSINNAGKRKVKALGEDPDMDEVDRVMIQTYIDKLKSSDNVVIVEVVKNLHAALDLI